MNENIVGKYSWKILGTRYGRFLIVMDLDTRKTYKEMISWLVGKEEAEQRVMEVVKTL